MGGWLHCKDMNVDALSSGYVCASVCIYGVYGNGSGEQLLQGRAVVERWMQGVLGSPSQKHEVGDGCGDAGRGVGAQEASSHAG